MLREQARRSDITATALSMVLKPAGVSHANLFGPAPVLTCQILLSPDIHENARWSAALDTWRWLHGGPAVPPAVELARLLRDAAASLEDRLAAAHAVLDALVWRDRERPARTAPGWLADVAEHLRARLDADGPIRIPEVARMAGVHPVHLARVFREHEGCTIATWVRRRRLQRLATAMPGPEPLSRLAYQHGFADHSHMAREFRRETGTTPGAYRDLVGDS